MANVELVVVVHGTEELELDELNVLVVEVVAEFELELVLRLTRMRN